MEYLFFDDEGQLQISDDQVKTLNEEFKTLMRSIYSNISQKYEILTSAVVQDVEMGLIDFPVKASDFHPEKLR